jgi:hypothetical protein
LTTLLPCLNRAWTSTTGAKSINDFLAFSDDEDRPCRYEWLREAQNRIDRVAAPNVGSGASESLCENSGFLLFFSGFLDFSHRL